MTTVRRRESPPEGPRKPGIGSFRWLQSAAPVAENRFMDHLWSPWTCQYVSSAGAVPSGKDYCLFCLVAAGADEDATNLVVFRGECCFVLLNRYPYSSGHL